MSHFQSWTGYPFLPDPALLFRQFKAGDQKILRMLFFHFYPALCFYAFRLIRDEEAANQIAEESLEKLWAERSGMESLEAIKVFLYLNTYQACSQFMKTPQNNSDSAKTHGNGLLITEDEAMAVIIYAEILSSIEEMPGAPEWLSSRLQRQPAGQIPPSGPHSDRPKPAPDDDQRGQSPI